MTIRATRQALAALLAPELDLAPERVMAYPPVPLQRPAVWVDRVSLDTSAPFVVFCGAGVVVEIVATAAGDTASQRETLDSYVETIWRVLVANGYPPLTAESESIEDNSTASPAYRIIASALR